MALEPLHVLNLCDALQVLTDAREVLHIMHLQLDFGIEDAVVCLDMELPDVDVELL